MEPIFRREGGRFLPTPSASGPWDPGLLHGGATASLLVCEIERLPTLADLVVARVTVELFRPVRRVPLVVATRVVREGKKLQLAEASLVDGDTEVARATALRLRRVSVPLPEGALAAGEPPPGPETGRETRPPFKSSFGFFDSFEVRAIDGNFGVPGPAAVWFRLRAPVVDDEPPSPAMRLAATADFGNGISSVLPTTDWTFVNPDLTVYAHREPRGEWILLRSRTTPESSGIGLAESILSDRQGPVGRSFQSLLLDRR